MYPEHIVKPMKLELVEAGFTEITTPEQAQEIIENNETVFVVINSVCGCGAASARPGAIMAVQTAEKKPDVIATVFAGVDKEATAKVREYMLPYPPSSPSMALFKNGELVFIIQRHQIEGTPPEIIAEAIKEAFNKYC